MDLANQLRTERKWFEQWRSISEFDQRRIEIKKLITPEFQFNNSSAKWLLEAWLLKEFGRITSAIEIRLSDNDPPDGYVRFPDRQIPLELTEAIEPGRRRGDEFKPDAPKIQPDPYEDWIRRAECIPDSLTETIRKKSNKAYSPDTQLLIYLNISEWGIRQKPIETFIRTALAKNIKPFEVVHVLWKDKIFSSDGKIHRDINPLAAEEDE